MNRTHRLLLLTIMMITLFCGAIISDAGIAMAQREDGKIARKIAPRPDAAYLETPDWAGTKNAGPSQKEDKSFYERCIINSDETMPATDRRAMCACMDAYQIRIHRTPKNEYWTNTIRTRQVTGYETFVTHVFAPCVYLESFALGARECYRQSHFANQFPNSRAFNDYCTCYANATEDYMRKYAEPLMASRMANLTVQELKYEPDPAQMLMTDPDYSAYIYREHKRCTAIYGYKVNE